MFEKVLNLNDVRMGVIFFSRYTKVMAQTFFFYDLETSGLSPRDDRIMQFAGQRTDMSLQPIGEPINVLVALNDDTLPSPDALMVTGITPQQTVAEGYTEAEFAEILMRDVFTPDTITVGFNNIRFDDEFIRHLFWRNFYDPYEWAWRDGRSRWDLLDAVRMTRALRPEGIVWPVLDGKPSNRLEELAKANGVLHTKAHDALSDVEALIALAALLQEKQPKLFSYLLEMRDKNAVKKLVNLDDKQPFVYVSGRFDAAYEKATIAFPLTTGRNSSVVVYDLRYDPTPFLEESPQTLADRLFAPYEQRQKDDFLAVPVKELQYNRSPAVAPLGVLNQPEMWQRIGLDVETITKHRDTLLRHPSFAENIRSAFESRPEFAKHSDPEGQLYDSFLPDRDTLAVASVRQKTADQLADFQPDFIDERLSPLLLHYKARSFPRSLSEEEMTVWELWRSARIQRQLPGFVKRLQDLSARVTDSEKTFILEELQLWAESIVSIEG